MELITIFDPEGGVNTLDIAIISVIGAGNQTSFVFNPTILTNRLIFGNDIPIPWLLFVTRAGQASPGPAGPFGIASSVCKIIDNALAIDTLDSCPERTF